MKVIGCTPVGPYVLVELLTQQEITGTKLFVADVTRKKIDEMDMPRHARILAIGSAVKPELGLKPGQRVVFLGYMLDVPRFGDMNRRKVLIEAASIQGIIHEAPEEEVLN